MTENLELEKSDARFYLKKPVRTVEEEPQPAAADGSFSTDVKESEIEISSNVFVEGGIPSGNESMDTPSVVPAASSSQTSSAEISYVPGQSF